MKNSTKQKILVKLCQASDVSSFGNLTKRQVWEKLEAISAKTKKAATMEIGKMFGFYEC